MPVTRVYGVPIVFLSALAAATALYAQDPSVQRFQDAVKPIISNYCFDCHADGMASGGMALDGFASEEEFVDQRELWGKILHRLRAQTMPPGHKPRPSPEEIDRIAQWVKYDAFGIDPANPDPGHTTLRRLNRLEYRNTIRDLMGTDYNTAEEFPADDSGYGFDNVGDALSISPLLMEKYLHAAEAIVFESVPAVSKVPREERLSGSAFRAAEGNVNGGRLDFDRQVLVSKAAEAKAEGTYAVEVTLRVNGGFDFEPGQCDLAFLIDETVIQSEVLAWETQRSRQFTVESYLEPGTHDFGFRVTPEDDPKDETSLSLRIEQVRITGPLEEEHWIAPDSYARFFHRECPPEPGEARDSYAREVLAHFASRAFRRPVDQSTVDRLAAFAKQAYDEPATGFEDGIRQAVVAVLASPRFLFLSEEPLAADAAVPFPRVDEYTLAARLSYFLWSTMPDDRLRALAGEGRLRENLDEQIDRMLQDPKAEAFIENFTGQWLQTRDVESVSINARAILGRRNSDFPDSLRRAMRQETTEYFRYIVEEDRDVLELVDSDYTFLNEELAKHYGIPGVEGDRMRRVELPSDSPRGGVLTQGALLTVTSNPTRTSPVKRGVFILESILGSSTPSPPPNVPELEEAAKADLGHEPTLRELLELHRNSSLCRSCHARFDPLGLALENFNALGMWRDEDAGQPIDPSGTLISGETFSDMKELKRILTHERKMDFYRCITEKLLTYALGRGIQYYDVYTVDSIVEALVAGEGRFSVLLEGVVQSAPFQRMRRTPMPEQEYDLAATR